MAKAVDVSQLDRDDGSGGTLRPWRYILSSGRTGTMFLEKFLNTQCPDVIAVHEPFPTREQMMLANLRNDWGLGGSLLARTFRTSREARDRQHRNTYVEINPFLCALTDLLPDPARELRVVHMVREPASWAVSMVAFKASTKFRHIIDYVPFAKPYPSPRPAGWGSLSEIDKALWRWHWCNSRLAALKDVTPYYCLVRYEDLFTENASGRNVLLEKIAATLGLDCHGPFDLETFGERRNPAPSVVAPPSPEATRRICCELGAQLGYNL
jgi:hypothetical protein